MTYMTETSAQLSTPKTNLETKKYQRKPFPVNAIQVTNENFEQVAAWCGGSIVTVHEPEGKNDHLFPFEAKSFIQVDVARPLTKRQTEAYIGDWILYAAKGFKVYANRPFLKNFEEVPEELMVVAESEDS